MTSLRVFLIALIIFGLAATAFLWRLTVSPLNIAFAASYIQAALHDPGRGMHAEMDNVFLHWPDLSGPILLGLNNGKIVNDKGDVIVSVDEAALTLSMRRLLIGQAVLKSLILKGPTLRVVRRADSGIDIGFGDITPENENKTGQQTDVVTRVLQYIAHPGSESGETSPLSGLRSFEIHNARVLMEDHRLGISWFLPNFDISFLSTKTGLSASLYFDLPDVGGQKSHIKGDVDYSWQHKNAAVALVLNNFDTHIFAGKIPELSILDDQDIVLDGRVEALLDSNLRPLQVNFGVSSEEGSLYNGNIAAEPVPYKDFIIEASYDSTKGALDLKQVNLTLRDATISAQGAFVQSDAGLSGPFKIEVANMLQSNIGPLWPEALKDDNSKIWIVDNITGGTYTSASASMNLSAVKDEAGEWQFDAKDLLADFAFENMSVSYRPPLSPVTKAKGKGHFDFDKEMLTVDVEEGMVDDIKITGGKVQLANIIAEGKGVADIHLKLNGPVKSAMLFAAKEPIDLHKKIAFDMNAVKGNAALDVKLNFPTIKDLRMEQLKIDIGGDMNDVFVPDILKDMDLTEGPLKLSVTNEAASVKGKGKLDGRAGEFSWMEYLESEGKPHKSKITAKVVADPELRERFGINLDEFIEGSLAVDVAYTEFDDNTAKADVAVDVMPARFFARPFDYEKPVGQPGSAKLEARFSGGILREVRGLTGEAKNFKLEESQIAFQQKGNETALKSGKISRFVLGETVSALDFEVENSGRYKVVMNGPFLDLRPFLNADTDKEKKYDDPPLLISVAVDAMRTADSETVQYGKIYADINSEGNFNQFEMDAIAGKGNIYLRFKPDETGKRTFRLEADDAGATLRAFSVYDKIVGGKLVAYGEPMRSVYDRNLIGLVQITDFKAVKAPVLAQLLGALSLPGLLNLLNDEGVTFTKMEADFNWLFHPQGSVLVLKNGRTSGNSLGLTFDGTFDKALNKVDVEGTIIPLSGINEIIGSIPLVGDILTGGSGSLFAATYSVKGTATEPKVLVNPLSILTPGILRRILFEQN